jgi:transcriptional regulator with XRE-family HTH domain
MKSNFEQAIKRNTPPPKTVGQMIREARKKKGMSQLQVANNMGVTRQYITQMENDYYAIGIKTLRRVVEEGLKNKFILDISKDLSFKRI